MTQTGDTDYASYLCLFLQFTLVNEGLCINPQESILDDCIYMKGREYIQTRKLSQASAQWLLPLVNKDVFTQARSLTADIWLANFNVNVLQYLHSKQ